MTKQEVTQMLTILKTAYPRFYADMSKEEAYNTIDLWTTMFANEDGALVVATVKELINSFKFPPTIADIKEKMQSLTGKNDETAMKYWHEFKRAVQNGLYDRKYKTFEEASEPLKEFLGSPSQLQDYALMDSETFNSVTKGQFLKQMEVILARRKEKENMLPETRLLIEGIAEQFRLENKGVN